MALFSGYSSDCACTHHVLPQGGQLQLPALYSQCLFEKTRFHCLAPCCTASVQHQTLGAFVDTQGDSALALWSDGALMRCRAS